MTARTRWLLSFGSNLEDATRVHAALDALPALGPCVLATAIRSFPAHHGDASYFSALAVLAFAGGRTELDAQLKALESRLGRERGRADHAVAIDIDILAHDAGHGWQADAHAQAKGEFAHADVRALLAEAGIELAGATS